MVASKSCVEGAEACAAPCELVGDVPKGEAENPNEEDEEAPKEEENGEEENGAAKVGEAEKGAGVGGVGAARGPRPRATSSSNSFELLITLHIVRTKSDPSEIALMSACVWLADAEVTWGGKRVGEVTRSTKRESAERPAEAMEEKGCVPVGV